MRGEYEYEEAAPKGAAFWLTAGLHTGSLS